MRPLFTLVLVSSNFVVASQPTYFNRAYNFGGADILEGVVEIASGYLVVGERAIGIRKGVILKVSETGDSLWSWSLSDTINHYSIQWLTKLPLGGFLCGGTARSNLVSPADWDHLFLKLDDTGAVMWTKMWGDTAIDEYVMDARLTNDGNYILISAHDYDVAPLWGQSALIKTDPDGNILWSYEYGENNYYNVPYQVVQTRDSGFLIVGYRSDQFGGNRDLMLIKADSLGNHEWTKYYGVLLDGFGSAVTKSIEGGYLIAGYQEIIDDQLYKGWLLKVDEDGNEEWDRFYSIANSTYGELWKKLIQLPDGSYVGIGGATVGFADRGWMLKVDCHGKQLWSRAYTRDSTWHHYFYGMDTTSDGGFIVCGSTRLQGQSQDAWLLKLDEYGCDTPGCHLQDTGTGVPCFTALPPGPSVGGESKIAVYPSPNNGTFMVQLPNDGEWRLQLFDLSGRLVEERRQEGSVEWDVSGLAQGLYLLKAVARDGTYASTKVLVE